MDFPAEAPEALATGRRAGERPAAAATPNPCPAADRPPSPGRTSADPGSVAGLCCAVRSCDLGHDGALRALRGFFPGSRFDAAVRGGPPAEVDLAFHLLDGAMVSAGQLRSIRVSRAGEGRRDPLGRFRLLFPSSGTLEGEAGGRPFAFAPGDVGLIDGDQPSTILAEDCRQVEVVVGRAWLAAAVPAFARLHGRTLRSTGSRILADHAASLGRHLATMAAGDVGSIGRATLGLVAACLDGRAPSDPAAPAGLKPAIRRRVERYIEGHLSSQALRPDAIARDLQIPRSTLYKAFAPLGGVSSAIQARRLDTARVLLAHPEEHRPIGEIAEALGFDRAATFSKAFGRRFGCSPREARHGTERDAADFAATFDRCRAIVDEETRARGATRAA